MIEESTDELLDYLADVIERAERFGATVMPPHDAETVAWEHDDDELAMDLAIHPPVATRSRLVEITLRERWRAIAGGRWELADYAYELRDDELDYRRALHRHDVDHLVRACGVATHEHCEATMGHPMCGHYEANPCRGALDGFERLYGVWLTGTKPDCSQLRCLR